MRTLYVVLIIFCVLFVMSAVTLGVFFGVFYRVASDIYESSAEQRYVTRVSVRQNGMTIDLDSTQYSVIVESWRKFTDENGQPVNQFTVSETSLGRTLMYMPFTTIGCPQILTISFETGAEMFVPLPVTVLNRIIFIELKNGAYVHMENPISFGGALTPRADCVT